MQEFKEMIERESRTPDPQNFALFRDDFTLKRDACPIAGTSELSNR
jgi:hypothetical protein